MSNHFNDLAGMMEDEIKPPWIEYPGYLPMDTFWRQPGEAWFFYVWEPYWRGLSEEQKEHYLQKWSVPQVWRDFYFDAEWSK